MDNICMARRHREVAAADFQPGLSLAAESQADHPPIVLYRHKIDRVVTTQRDGYVLENGRLILAQLDLGADAAAVHRGQEPARRGLSFLVVEVREVQLAMPPPAVDARMERDQPLEALDVPTSPLLRRDWEHLGRYRLVRNLLFAIVERASWANRLTAAILR